MKFAKLIKRFRIEKAHGFKLADFDPADTCGMDIGKSAAKDMIADGLRHLTTMQEKLYAQNRWALLIVLQGMDASGKDGVVKHVMSGLNPQGCRVTSFKAPSAEELDHDYLWRHFKVLPERGHIGIFNRSHYEEVLVVRLNPDYLEKQQLPPEVKGRKIWRRRFEQINNFEKYLSENGIVVLKIFLNVSKEEQKKRFLARIDEAEKNWKFSPADAKNRLLWDKYMEAYEDCFNHTSTPWAPWYVVPADQKPYSRLLVALLIYHSLAKMKLAYPAVDKERRAELLKIRKLLESE
jgi:PPK2 family polyphosphate:nucleotide phosphotransferase